MGAGLSLTLYQINIHRLTMCYIAQYPANAANILHVKGTTMKPQRLYMLSSSIEMVRKYPCGLKGSICLVVLLNC